jgi:hypothetical protein
MKPHEEKWDLASDGTTVDCGGGAALVQMRPPGQSQRAGVARLASAAPDMARALVELLARIEREGPADVVDPLYDAGREALQKAGVL